MRVSPFGNLRVEAYVQLTAAYRSLSRPSSAPDAKAFPLRSSSLDLFWFSNVNAFRIMQALLQKFSYEIVFITHASFSESFFHKYFI